MLYRGGPSELMSDLYGLFQRDVLRTDLSDEQIEHLCAHNARFEKVPLRTPSDGAEEDVNA